MQVRECQLTHAYYGMYYSLCACACVCVCVCVRVCVCVCACVSVCVCVSRSCRNTVATGVKHYLLIRDAAHTVFHHGHRIDRVGSLRMCEGVSVSVRV